MDWSDERYVRLYTRDTVTWRLIKWQGRHVLTEIFRKVDRAGVLDFGEEGINEAVSALIDTPIDVVAVGIEKLIERGVAVIKGHSLVLPNFIEAQEAKQSDKHRQRESRAKRRDLAKHAVTKRDSPEEAGVTKRDREGVGDENPGVTKPVTTVTKPVTGDGDPIETVTLSLAMPSLAMPSASQNQTQTREDARAGAGAIPEVERDRDGFPIQPKRKPELLPVPVEASEYEPLPGHEPYAMALGLTRSEYQATLEELVQKNHSRGAGPATATRWDARLCGFIEAAVSSKTRVRGTAPKLSVVAPATAPAKPREHGPIARMLFQNADDEFGPDEDDEVGQEA